MDHLKALSTAADVTLFKTNADLVYVEEAVHAFLDTEQLVDHKQLGEVLDGDSRIGLPTLQSFTECMASSERKHLVQFGALAILTAVAWDYQPQGTTSTMVDRNSTAAMSALTSFIYGHTNRLAQTAQTVALAIGNTAREHSTEDIQLALSTYVSTSSVPINKAKVQPETSIAHEKIVHIDDAELLQKIADFPWIDTPATDIVLDARLVAGLNNTDVLIVDLSPYSSRMQVILQDARAHFDESVFRSMELPLIAKLITGDQSGRQDPPPTRDPNLPEAYVAKNVATNHALRRVYVARLCDYQNTPVFARLGFSRTVQRQSELSQLLGYRVLKT